MADIIVYTTPTCPWCKRAKAYLETKGVSYVEKDITKDRSWIDELRRISGQLGIPVITDGTRVVIGFNTSALDAFVTG
ncbi:MAG: glutaredoxin family protein [Thermoplasmata archaeon]